MAEIFNSRESQANDTKLIIWTGDLKLINHALSKL